MTKKSGRNDVASVILDRSAGGGNGRGFKLWTASFRRKIIDTMRCGGGATAGVDNKLVKKPETRSDPTKKAGSEKLSELLRLSHSWNEMEEEEVKRKVKVLEEMKGVVKRLQGDDVLWGAKEVRRLTKEDVEARSTLALLGAIPTLVGLLDLENVEIRINSLYALLNLGIGNDGLVALFSLCFLIFDSLLFILVDFDQI